ncbi:ABC transporter substrate-binding protein [Bradyrhizobium monzae]|uniref:ABC transporter substrate-binding protein n=1 Tax=Bradyrhizobium sp. Oc8 TaxID=2876780 RepID=UPI001F18651A|nr:ABC transporter substrate-binding protein [Bradyrhizobium sp. Oc8]
MKKSDFTASRRSFLAGTAGALMASAVLGPARAAAKSDTVTIINYGGSYQDATVKAVFEPFTKETGIKVENVPVPGLDKIKAMELTGNVEIDIFIGPGTWAASGSKQGFWEKLDLSMLDLKDLAIQPTNEDVTYEVVTMGIAWDPKKFGPGKHPSDFVEYFDLKKFPGRRCFRPVPDQTLEAALLADGVAPKDLYPLDLDRAFKSLNRIKSSIVWAQTVPQTIFLVQRGEVDFTYTSVNRIKATNDEGGGVPLAFSFDQNLIITDSLGILKGAPNKENAMKLIAYILRPEVQARLYDLLGLLPASTKAKALMSEAARKWLPDLSNPKNVTISSEYWANNFEKVNPRFLEWIQS